MAEKRYIKVWANLEDVRKTSAGPDLSLGVGTVDLFATIQEGIANGNLDITGDLGNTLVTTTDTQTISGAKTFSAAITASAGIVGGASADITLNTNKFTVDATNGNTVVAGTVKLSGIPEYADNAAALAGGLTAGDLYKTAAGALNITVAA